MSSSIHHRVVTIVVQGRWHAFDLCRELTRRKFSFRLITTYPKFVTRKWGISDEAVSSLPLHLLLSKVVWRLGGERMATKCQYIINNIFAESASARLGPTGLVHCWSGAAEPTFRRARAQGIPCLLERSSSHIIEQTELMTLEYEKQGLNWEPTPAKGVARELAEYQLADRILVPSGFVEDSFKRHGVAAQKLRRIAFGVNLTTFPVGIPHKGAFTVLYIGSVSVRKGMEYLVRGFRSAEIDGSRLVVIGGSTRDGDRILNRLGGDDIVRVPHLPQDELKHYYAKADVFCMASIEEGLAYVQAQALASGLPLVCSENTGGRDLLELGGAAGQPRGDGITEYPAGYVVPVRDAAAIGKCLAWLAADRSLRLRKRDAALAIRNFALGWDTHGGYVVQCYEEMLSSSSAKTA
jgi:glycosyltransferase involved in cell wall biosynthesis